MTSPQITEQTTPVFAPDGSIRKIPDTSLRDAFAAGAKLAVQVKAPNGDVVYVPHDHIGDAIKAGGQINSEQGTKSEPHPQEGFWHSLGSVFGLTPEQLNQKPSISSAIESGLPGAALLHNAVNAAPGMAKKAMAESAASNDSLKHGDITSFLAHQIGGMGYTAATVASPFLGDSPAKAGEQLGEGNVKGALGTTTGLIAPVVIGGEAGNINDALPESPDLAAKATAIAKTAGKEITGKIPVLSRFERFRTPTFEQWRDAFMAKADPSFKPEFASDEEIMDRVLNPDNGVRLPSATSLPSRQLPRGAIELPASDLPVNRTAPPVAATTRAQRLGLLLPDKAGGPIALGQGEGVPLTPSQQATLSAAESKAQAVPAGEPQSSQPSTLPRVASGEGVLNKALTSLDNKNLLKIAKSRGIDVSREAQLKPGAANGTLIKKIIDDFSPDELDEIRNMGMEISRNLPVQNPNVTPEAAAEAWHYKVLSQFFPDVSIPKTMAARAQATIANRPLSAADYAKARFQDAQAAAQPTTDWSLENMAKQIRLNQAKRSASAGND